MRSGQILRGTTCSLVAATLLLVLPEFASACPTCKEGLHANHIALAFAASIVLMMSMPFLLIGCWIVAVYQWRQTDRRNQAQQQQLPTVAATDLSKP